MDNDQITENACKKKDAKETASWFFWEVWTAQQLFANPQPTGAGSSRFTASLMGPVFTITVPGSLQRDAIKIV